MNNIKKAALISVLLIAGVAAGFFISNYFNTKEPASSTTSDSFSELKKKNEQLQNEIAGLKERIKNLENLLQIERMKNQNRSLQVAKIKPAITRGKYGTAKTFYKLNSIEEADAIFEKSIEKLDIDSLLKLYVTLLSMGEEGYKKIFVLLEEFNQRVNSDELLKKWLWGGERFGGNCFRYFAENHKNLIRFGLYTFKQDPKNLPKPLRQLEYNFSEIAPVILGYYDGSDTEINNDCMDLLEQKIDEELQSKNRTYKLKGYISSVSQIKNKRASDLLIGLIDYVDGSLLDYLVMSIGYQGNKQATPVLEELRRTNQDPDVSAAIDIALLRLR